MSTSPAAASSGKSPAEPRPSARRADAARNRERVLAAARELLAEDDDATMQAVAKRAGVGQGTLYRHFPTRESLLLEVYQEDFAALVTAAPRLLAETATPARALRAWLDELAAFGRRKHALAAVLDAATRADLHEAQYQPVLDAIGALLDAGKADGTVRPDAAPDELLPLAAFLWHLDTRADPRVPRLLDLVAAAFAAPA